MTITTAPVPGIDTLRTGTAASNHQRTALPNRPRALMPKRVHPVRPPTEALGRHREIQDEEKRAVGPDWSDEDLVFTTSIGTPMDPRNCQRWWDRMCRRAGIGKRRPHAARHTTATAALAAGLPVTEVATLLGHSNPATTLRMYAHATGDGGAKVGAAIDGWIRSGQEPPDADPT